MHQNSAADISVLSERFKFKLQSKERTQQALSYCVVRIISIQEVSRYMLLNAMADFCKIRTKSPNSDKATQPSNGLWYHSET